MKQLDLYTTFEQTLWQQRINSGLKGPWAVRTKLHEDFYALMYLVLTNELSVFIKEAIRE